MQGGEGVGQRKEISYLVIYQGVSCRKELRASTRAGGTSSDLLCIFNITTSSNDDNCTVQVSMRN